MHFRPADVKIARFLRIEAERIDKPDEVVAAPRPDTSVRPPVTVGAGMPPMLDVALLKLVRR